MLAGKSFAHEYALVSSLAAAPYLLVPDGGIETLIFGHRLVRIEANLAVAAAHRFRLGKAQQPTTQSGTLPHRGDGDIAEQQIFGLGRRTMIPAMLGLSPITHTTPPETRAA